MTIRCLALSVTIALAGEYSVMKGDVMKTLELEVTVLPEKAVPLLISKEEWTDLKVSAHKSHGDPVTEGEPVISLKKEPLENAITDLKDEILLMTQELDLMKKKLEDSEVLAPLALKKLEAEVSRSKEDHSYYLETLVPQQKKSYDKFIERAEWDVKSASEELRQLKAMYEEDEITEDTEEIILERSKFIAKNAEYQLEKAGEEFGHLKNVRLPRNIEDKNLQREQDAYTFEERKRTIPFELEKLKLEVAQKEKELKRKEERLEKLEADAVQMDLLSPVPGVFFYGLIKDGDWTGAPTTEKFMRKGGLIPTEKEFACIIPEGAETLGFSQVESASLSALKPGLSGIMKVKHQEETPYAISCASVSSSPLTNEKFLASFSLPPEVNLPLTTNGKATLLIAEKDEVLRIPKKAVKLRPDGSTTVSLLPQKEKAENDAPSELKEEEKSGEKEKTGEIVETDVADSPEKAEKEGEKEKLSPPKEKVNTKKITIQLGLYGDEYVEVLSGLKEGDVIQTP